MFDGFWWRDGPVSNSQVMREFVLAWRREFPDDVLTVAVPRHDVPHLRPLIPLSIRLAGTRMPQHGLCAILELPWVARRAGADVMLVHNFAPLMGRSAVFVHDLMFVTSPQWFTRLERAYFGLMPLLLRRASAVFTSSQTEAHRISDRAPGHPAVIPVGLGLSRDLSTAAPRRPEVLDGVEEFLLSVGRLNARKNLGTAVEAAVLSGRATPRTPLLVVGEPEGRRAEFSDSVADAVADGSVRFLGFLESAELAWLYHHARVFVFLSLDEGFGMPTLEALHFGAPVVASDIPVFREILGSRAHYADPTDVAAASRAIAVAWDGGRLFPVAAQTLGYSWELSVRRIRAALPVG